jgi:hypothetical protein
LGGGSVERDGVKVLEVEERQDQERRGHWPTKSAQLSFFMSFKMAEMPIAPMAIQYHTSSGTRSVIAK